ncbi:MAG: ADP-ribosylglycohydrolase family protein [Pseudomonadota bacterium]
MDRRLRDRVEGAVLGTLIGDALGAGCHWYYDLEAFHRDHGPWVRDYVAPRPGGWHEGLSPGDSSQTGQVALLLLESLAEHGTYHQEAFTARLDDLLATLDGTVRGGRVTDIAMRDLWAARRSGTPWSETGSLAETSEAATRAVMLIAAYAEHPEQLAAAALANVRLTHCDPFIAAQALAFTLTTASLVQGGDLRLASQRSRRWVEGLGVTPQATDCFLQPAFVERAATHPKLQGLDPVVIAEIYGLPCQQGMLLPAAYWYASRFAGDFENAVLTAVNSGGNNMARAGLTGALVGARVGTAGIPKRFLQGLVDLPRARAALSRLLDN